VRGFNPVGRVAATARLAMAIVGWSRTDHRYANLFWHVAIVSEEERGSWGLIMKRQSRKSCVEMLESRILLTVGGPVADAYSMSEDTTLIVGKNNGVIANDIGVTAIALGLPPENGVVLLSKNGSFGYQPNPNFVGQDIFTYRTKEQVELDSEESTTVTITVNQDTSDVDAVDDFYQIDQDTFLHVDAANGLLANDSYVKNVTSLVQKAQHGKVHLFANGSFNYTPNEGFYGIDTFVYRGVGRPGSDAATVSIFVLQTKVAPVAEDDFYQVDEDTTLIVNTPGVLGNDTDLNQNTLIVTVLDQPQHGSLILNEYGSFEYTPDANWYGEDQFNYTVSDGELTDSGNVIISVLPINDPPVAVDDYLVMNEDDSIVLDIALANDTDADADILTMGIIGEAPRNGALYFLNGQWIYEPDPNYYGNDSFTYEAQDNESNSAPATITIEVLSINDPPVASDELFGVLEDTPLTVDAPGVLLNDSDGNGENEPISAVLVNTTEHGTLLFNPDGSFTYIPDLNYFGTDSFQYLVNDGDLDSNVATTTLEIAPVDDPPVVNDDVYETDEDEVLVVEAPGVLANDVDIDQETLIATLIIGTEHGEILFNIDGSFAYSPDADWYGVDTFQYIASDENVETLIGWVTITVNPVNDIPHTQAESYETTTDELLTTTENDGVLANDYDVDGDILSVTLSEAPEFGTLFLATNGAFVYTPNTGYTGNDFFIYHVEDGNGGFADTSVMIIVREPSATFEFIPEGKAEILAVDAVFAQLGEKNIQTDLWSDLNDEDQIGEIEWHPI
jgi:hypothetical protein